MVKKKSKFRHISISNKKYYFYEIKWVDVIGDSGHAWTFASYDEETFSDRNLIPKGLILSMKKVEI